MKVICNSISEKCNPGCNHLKPHDEKDNCKKLCYTTYDASCIPIEENKMKSNVIEGYHTGKQNGEEAYLEFIYCLYKGKLQESTFLHSKENKSFHGEAFQSYKFDPFFNAIYNLNKDLMKNLLKQED